MSQTVILGTARTPFGKMGGAFASKDATELGGAAIEAALERSGVDARAGRAGDLRPGAAGRPGADPLAPGADQGRDPEGGPLGDRSTRSAPRACARSGSPTRRSAPATSRSASPAAWSRCRTLPTCFPGARFGFRMGDVTAVDAMTHDGLTNPFTDKQMINEASEVSNELEITRPDMDRWAARSHQLAAKATDEGRLADEIVSVTVKSRKAETVVEADEAIRPDSTVESLAKLQAIGGDDATHTAGNAPGVNDGAAAVVVASEEWASANGATPLAPGRSPTAQIADDFPYLARTPAKAAQAGAREGRQVGRRRRPLGDQRGVRLGRPQLAADARRRRGQRQRQRRRDRARPPDRRLRRADRRRARARAPAPRRRPRLRRDLLRRRPGRRDPHRGQRRLSASPPRRARSGVLRSRPDPDGGVLGPVVGAGGPCAPGSSAAGRWRAGLVDGLAVPAARARPTRRRRRSLRRGQGAAHRGPRARSGADGARGARRGPAADLPGDARGGLRASGRRAGRRSSSAPPATRSSS